MFFFFLDEEKSLDSEYFLMVHTKSEVETGNVIKNIIVIHYFDKSNDLETQTFLKTSYIHLYTYSYRPYYCLLRMLRFFFFL